MKNNINANDLLIMMCKLNADIPFGYDPKIYSIKRLADRMNCSEYMVRKRIKELEAEGLVCKDYDGGQDEDGNVYCYHGWSITEKAVKTELYKRIERQAYREFADFMKRCDDELKQEG